MDEDFIVDNEDEFVGIVEGAFEANQLHGTWTHPPEYDFVEKEDSK